MTAKLAAVPTDNHPRRNLKPVPTSGRLATPQEIRAMRDAAGDSQAAAARRVRASRKAWIKWESESESEHRRMPPGLVELYCIKTGQPVPAWLSTGD